MEIILLMVWVVVDKSYDTHKLVTGSRVLLQLFSYLDSFVLSNGVDAIIPHFFQVPPRFSFQFLFSIDTEAVDKEKRLVSDLWRQFQ